MPATIWTANTVKVSLRYLWMGQECYTVQFVRCAGIPTLNDLSAIKNIYYNWENGYGRTHRSSSCTYRGAKFLSIHGPGGVFLDWTPVTPEIIVVGAVGILGTSYESLVIRLVTGLSGRSYAGRIFWVGTPSNRIETNGLVFGNLADATAVAVKQLVTNLTAGGYSLVVNSSFSGKDANGNSIPRAAGLATNVLNVTYSPRVGIQKRRYA